MEWKSMVTAALELIEELADTDEMDGAAKLERVTDLVASAIEAADDLVLFLPAGIRPFAKMAVDNPMVDGWQREYLAKPVAEMLYQGYKALRDLLQN